MPEVRVLKPETFPATLRGAVVAIGNFDGMHLGHQAVIAAAREEADRRGVACLVLTFEPHPRAFFADRDIFRLTPLPLKAAAAAALGVDATIVVDFDRALADHSAEDFVDETLIETLGISAAVTGYDFHFGKARRGTPAFLQRMGVERGFGVSVIGAKTQGDAPVSSTRIRQALADGDAAAAAGLLGWRYAFVGTVEPGEARGRRLGYPTANMSLDPAAELAQGIYAVRYLRPDGSLHAGVASYGRRPTFDNGRPLFETFLFDFSGDLYGETALVALYGFIRAEQHFDTAEALVARMDTDSLEARALLERSAPGDLDMRIGVAWLNARKAGVELKPPSS